MDKIKPFSEDITTGSEKFAGLTIMKKPTEKQKKQMEKETDTLINKKVAKAEMELGLKTSGQIPSWWPKVPESAVEKEFLGPARKLIRDYDASAIEIEDVLVRAAAKKDLTKRHKDIIKKGWPRDAEKIIAGEKQVCPFRYPYLGHYGEFYHRDVGWY